ncbi:peroxisomal biogenesis factor 19 [Phymastichus coffea]|uniref:peroxisomal biogenesis factor 19 n=1 Tax=Phymastichus coffea TaxID=108790 RepID=UPI00273C079D|nr:peroxisomal biogenesis factor 19 [Phymastichus coffea]
MSDEKKTTNPAEDAELNELLDSALKDFDKPVKPVISTDDGSSTSVVVKPEEERNKITSEEVWIDDFVKQAADQFQRNFDDLLHNNGNFSESFKKLADSVAGSVGDSSDVEAPPPDFQSAINQALKDLSANSENLQNVPNISEADLAAMFGQTSLEGGDFLPFMQGMAESLISKEILYPSMKDIVDRYPAWLEENRATVPPTDLANYEKQYELMSKVCLELESEKDDDSEEVKKKRFEKKLAIMQEIQAYGSPPEDLMITDVEPEKCSIM